MDEIPMELQEPVRNWAKEYAKYHAVAHWDDRERKNVANYEASLEHAAKNAEHLLSTAKNSILPRFLDYYPAIVWEDQDECLEVRPDEIK
jgi:hypothetical protein